jgi:hypothetical protein
MKIEKMQPKIAQELFGAGEKRENSPLSWHAKPIESFAL